jgi:hypothetical protein
MEPFFYATIAILAPLCFAAYYLERWWNWRYYSRKVKEEIEPLKQEIEKLKEKLSSKSLKDNHESELECLK